jgi:hypothetical protein
VIGAMPSSPVNVAPSILRSAGVSGGSGSGGEGEWDCVGDPGGELDLAAAAVSVAVAAASWRRLVHRRRAAILARPGPARITLRRAVRRAAEQFLAIAVRRPRQGTALSLALTVGLAMVAGTLVVAFAAQGPHLGHRPVGPSRPPSVPTVEIHVDQ